MARKSTKEPGLPQVLSDMRRAYSDEPRDDDRDTVKEFRDMRRAETAKFHSLLHKYEEQWTQAKAARDKVNSPEGDNRDSCDVLVGKLLDEWDRIK